MLIQCLIKASTVIMIISMSASIRAAPEIQRPPNAPNIINSIQKPVTSDNEAIDM